MDDNCESVNADIGKPTDKSANRATPAVSADQLAELMKRLGDERKVITGELRLRAIFPNGNKSVQVHGTVGIREFNAQTSAKSLQSFAIFQIELCENGKLWARCRDIENETKAVAKRVWASMVSAAMADGDLGGVQ